MFGIDRIAGNRLLPLSFGGKIAYQDFLGLVALIFCHVSYSVFRISQSLFFWELIFCMFCYSYTRIGIDGIVPKEHALNLHMTYCTLYICTVISGSTVKSDPTGTSCRYVTRPSRLFIHESCLLVTLVPEVFSRREETRETKKRREKTSGCGRCESHYHATIAVN